MTVTEAIALDNRELTRFFFAIVMLLSMAHGCGYLFRHFNLPRVMGEIAGGVLLGPTVLGYFLPRVHQWLFNAFEAEGKLISIVYWFGLVLLMFISGFEIQKSFSRADRAIIGWLVTGATLIPFLAGWFAPAVFDFSSWLGPERNMLALRIVIAIAVAVTSIPVISKIFIDLGMMETRFAKIVVATATIQDIILWIALAIATGLVSGTAKSAGGIAATVAVTLIFFFVSLLVMPRLVAWINASRYNLLLKSSGAAYVLFICFLFAAVASVLDVNLVFGAFLAGVVVGRIPERRFQQSKEHIREFAMAFFIPIYFAVVGLKLDLVRGLDLRFLLGFLLFSTVFETAGTLLAARLARVDRLSSFNLAVAMNARGGPGIVLATVAYDLGIINEAFFVTLVLVAILTSLLAGWWFRFVLRRGWDLLAEEPPRGRPEPRLRPAGAVRK